MYIDSATITFILMHFKTVEDDNLYTIKDWLHEVFSCPYIGLTTIWSLKNVRKGDITK